MLRPAHGFGSAGSGDFARQPRSRRRCRGASSRSRRRGTSNFLSCTLAVFVGQSVAACVEWRRRRPTSACSRRRPASRRLPRAVHCPGGPAQLKRGPLGVESDPRNPETRFSHQAPCLGFGHAVPAVNTVRQWPRSPAVLTTRSAEPRVSLSAEQRKRRSVARRRPTSHCTGRQPAPRFPQARYTFACGLPPVSGNAVGRRCISRGSSSFAERSPRTQGGIHHGKSRSALLRVLNLGTSRRPCGGTTSSKLKIDVDAVHGSYGEYKVLVDGETVVDGGARVILGIMPSGRRVVEAVRSRLIS